MDIAQKQKEEVDLLRQTIEAQQQEMRELRTALNACDWVRQCKACHGRGVWRDRLTENEWGDPYPCPVCTAPAEKLQQEIARLKERTAKLEARLEMDHAYDQDGRRVEIPAADRDKYPDGISCRDETIRLQDEAVDKLQRQLAEAQARIKELEGEP